MSQTTQNKTEITRREAREQAFALVFEKTFHDCGFDEIICNASDASEIVVDNFAKKEAEGVYENLDEIDGVISANLRGWTIARISRVALSILRLAVYEIKYSEEVPTSVAINEAVELAKKFGTDDDPSYINGVLGSVAKAVDA